MSGRFGRQPFEGVRVPRNRGGRNIGQVAAFSDKIIEAHTRCPFQSVFPSLELHPRMSLNRRRDGRVAEGARLESVFRGNSNVGSNPTLSAKLLKIKKLNRFINPPSPTLTKPFRLWN